jgi:hypothetical protein
MKKFLLILITTVSVSLNAGDYPLPTCVVSGEKLGEMGEPYVFKVEDTEVQLCCKMCKPKFDKDPEKHLTPIHDAASKATGK